MNGLRWGLGLALWVGLAWSAEVQGASLLDVALKTDGSAEPPGDRVSLVVAFAKDEPALMVEVRAFLVPKDAEQNPVPVKARGEKNRDAAGMFLVGREVQRPAENGLAEVDVVVPYGDLEIALGEHRLGYEVRAVREGAVLFVAATPAVGVTIRTAPRTAMMVRERSQAPAARKVEVRAFVQKNGREADEETFAVEGSNATAGETSRRVAVDIPRGFVRPIAQRGAEPTSTPAKIASSSVESERNRVVHFATNRNVVAASGTPAERFGSDVAEGLSFGTCRVTIPLAGFHSAGNLERPGFWNYWSAQDNSRFFLIDATSVLDAPGFLGSLKINGKPGDVLVFIHGYNTNFDSMILRAAQLAHDTGMSGRTVVFSWPSAGKLAMYGRDETMAAASGTALAEVLRTLIRDQRSARTVPAAKIHLIAHSMGNRVLLDALNRVAKDEGIGKPFGDIVLAAPDVDVVDFCEQSIVLNDLAETSTLYSCSKDRALNASRTVHAARRLGEQCFFAKGLDLQNVNADNADTSFLGHGYIVSGEKVLKDLQLLMMLELRAERRPTLSEATTTRGSRFWLFR